MRPFNLTLRTLCVTGLLIASVSAGRAQDTKGRIGFVRGQMILPQTPGYARADSQYAKEVGAFQAELTKMGARFDSLGQRFQETSPMLSAADRAVKQKQLEALQDTLTKLNTDLKNRADQRRQELMAPIEDRVTAVLDGLRGELNLDYILDIDAMGTAVVSVNKSLDLTQKAIERLAGTAATQPKKPGGP